MEGKTRSESLETSLPHAPFTEPKTLEEPFAKKQKVGAISDISKDQDGDEEFERFPNELTHDAKDTDMSSQKIDEGWEDVGKDKDSVEIGNMPLDDEPVKIEGTKEKMAKVMEADGEVASKASGVPNMLTKDW